MSVNVEQIRRSKGYHALIGVGLVSYGLVHLVLAWLALQVAFGRSEDASAGGALQQLTQQPLGTGLLWVDGGRPVRAGALADLRGDHRPGGAWT